MARGVPSARRLARSRVLLRILVILLPRCLDGLASRRTVWLCVHSRVSAVADEGVPVAERCSPPSGCGVRSTSTTSSCRSPSTAPGPRGTRTSTTARGKQLGCHSDFGAHGRCRLYERARWPNKRSAAEEAGCCKHKIPKKKHNNTRSALVRCAWFDSTRSRCHKTLTMTLYMRAHLTPPQAGTMGDVVRECLEFLRRHGGQGWKVVRV